MTSSLFTKISIRLWPQVAALAFLPYAAFSAPTAIDYNRDVRPILSAKCFACHGFDEATREGGLRLDQATSESGDCGALDDRGSGAAVVPGDPAASELWRRINSTDQGERMPPAHTHQTLDGPEKEALRRWIEQGAAYAKHWSFVRPKKAPLPKVAHNSWPRNEIDRFVLARIEDHDLRPSPEGDERMLVRRLYLDLTGLPPSAAEVEAFVADAAPGAYERLVDRLLASPHYGERMALEWLDVARYADTNGYSIDGGRHIWLWRDWVINAFQQNMPYDQFLVEQLAGDLLPQPTPAQLIATGFQRNNMVTHEGGTIPAENLTNYNADRVKTLGEAVLGLTLGCAQCHDHKYDPITQREYYQLYAYFNTLSDVGLDGDRGVNPRPSINAETVLPNTELPELRARIETVQAKLDQQRGESFTQWRRERQAILKQRGRGFQAYPTQLLNISTPNAGAGYEIEEGRFVRILRAPKLVAYDCLLRLPEVQEPITGLRIVFYPDSAAPGGGWGWGRLAGASANPDGDKAKKGVFVLTALAASAGGVPASTVDLHHLLGVERMTANSWRPDYRPENVLDARRENGWSPDASLDGSAHITLSFTEPIDTPRQPYLTVHVNFGQLNQLVGARFAFQVTTGVDDDSDLPREIISILQRPSETPSEQEREQLYRYFAEHSHQTKPLRTELANLRERVSVLTDKHPTMIMDEAHEPRETYFLARGNYAAPTERVTPGTLAVLPPLPKGAPTSRLGLAQWVTMPGHPLTARVAVNRIWSSLMGAGLVRTPADFGAQGAWPTHPELLDWLAVDFIESGWNTNALVRKIVTSATYRQSSATPREGIQPSSQADQTESPTSSLLNLDPSNELLARGSRFRLSAEFIRDSALQVSGLLVPRVGGPSVNPYTPGDLWREVSHYGSTPATAQTFRQDHGEKLYRRSLYTYWKRTVPPPNLAAFDASTRETCVVQRASTTTPLQALVLLNDVQFVEASRAFAERILARSAGDDVKLRWAFEECASRLPTERELEVLVGLLQRERDRYAADQAAARAYLSSGESPRDEQIPVAEHAAWSQVAALLLNLSETITRN